ncbi:MAG: FecR family protein, partial [Rhodocyclaceae bacterium]
MVLGALFWTVDTRAAGECASPAGKIVSVQGVVDMRSPAVGPWLTAPTGARLCPGDQVRVARYGRAAVFLDGETTLRLDQESTLTIGEAKQEGVAKATILDLLRGAIHVITRTPQPFKINTPFVNAGVEGTEFAIDVGADQARVATFEGQVTLSNAQGALHLVASELALVAANQAPTK